MSVFLKEIYKIELFCARGLKLILLQKGLLKMEGVGVILIPACARSYFFGILGLERPERGRRMIETIILGVACLSAPLFAKYAGYEIRKKPYDMVGVGGLFFLLGAAFALGPAKVEFLANIAAIGSIAAHVIGWLHVIVGAFRSMIDVMLERDEVPARPRLKRVA